MKPFVRATVFLTLGLVLAVIVSGADENNGDAAAKENENDEETIKIYKRLIPADVLRGKQRSKLFFNLSISTNTNRNHVLRHRTMFCMEIRA